MYVISHFKREHCWRKKHTFISRTCFKCVFFCTYVCSVPGYVSHLLSPKFDFSTTLSVCDDEIWLLDNPVYYDDGVQCFCACVIEVVSPRYVLLIWYRILWYSVDIHVANLYDVDCETGHLGGFCLLHSFALFIQPYTTHTHVAFNWTVDFNPWSYLNTLCPVLHARSYKVGLRNSIDIHGNHLVGPLF